MTANCPTCNGTGYRPMFSHICKGICFHCGGGGKVTATASKADGADKAPKAVTRPSRLGGPDGRVSIWRSGKGFEAEVTEGPDRDARSVALVCFEIVDGEVSIWMKGQYTRGHVAAALRDELQALYTG